MGRIHRFARSVISRREARNPRNHLKTAPPLISFFSALKGRP